MVIHEPGLHPQRQLDHNMKIAFNTSERHSRSSWITLLLVIAGLASHGTWAASFMEDLAQPHEGRSMRATSTMRVGEVRRGNDERKLNPKADPRGSRSLSRARSRSACFTTTLTGSRKTSCRRPPPYFYAQYRQDCFEGQEWRFSGRNAPGLSSPALVRQLFRRVSPDLC